MNDRKTPPPTIDGLLKRVLEDDLPPGVRSKMEKVVRRFKERAEGEGADDPAGRGGDRPELFWLRPDWRLGRRILAFSSFLLIVCGGILHLAGPRSAMADSIYRLNALVSISRQVRLAEAMDVSARSRGTDGSLLDYSLTWRAPGAVRMEVRSGGRIIKTLTVGGVQDPIFQPILRFGSPAAFADLIEAKWNPLGIGKSIEPGRDIFFFADPEDRMNIELSVDPASLLPAEIGMTGPSPGKEGITEEAFLQVYFTWGRKPPSGGSGPASGRIPSGWSGRPRDRS